MEQRTVRVGDLRAALALFMPLGAVVEIRALGVQRKGLCSGYFNNPKAALEAACELSGEAEGVYITLNPCIPDIMARAANRIKTYARHSTGDVEITHRRWFLVDCDPVRPKGISSTDEEHKYAHRKAMDIKRYMKDQGWSEPLHASSGNGAHLLFRIDDPNNAQARDTYKDLLRALAHKFKDPCVEVDVANFNASRICRLYGTMARKGDPTAERPHRISRILFNPFLDGGDGS